MGRVAWVKPGETVIGCKGNEEQKRGKDERGRGAGEKRSRVGLELNNENEWVTMSMIEKTKIIQQNIKKGVNHGQRR